MADDNGTVGEKTLFLPGLAHATELLGQLVSQDQAARLLAAANAPQQVKSTNGTLTANAVVRITEAQQRTIAYTFLVVVFTEAASGGYYDSAVTPKADGTAGFRFAAGGGALIVYGSQNIANFAMIAETAGTAPYNYGLYI